jgi:hypothetical protein
VQSEKSEPVPDYFPIISIISFRGCPPIAVSMFTAITRQIYPTTQLIKPHKTKMRLKKKAPTAGKLIMAVIGVKENRHG